MDLSLIQKAKSHLEKELAKSEPDSEVISDILNQLQNGFTATADILKKTKVGLILTQVRKHKSISAKNHDHARELVAKWKREVGISSGTSTTPSLSSEVPGKSNNSSNVTMHSIKTESTALQPSSSTPTDTAALSPNPVERTVKSDELSPPSTGDRLRDRCIEMLYAAMALGSFNDGERILSKAKGLEELVWQTFDHTTDERYKSRIRSFCSNLKGNMELRESVVEGFTAVKRLATMSTQDMMNSDQRVLAEKARKENMHDAVSAMDTQAETDMFKCGKCKARKCKYYQMQTRSADEPMTTFVTCVNCGNKWKFC